MSQSKATCKRDAEDARMESSSASFSSPKRSRVCDSGDFGDAFFGSTSLVRPVSPEASSGGFSATSSVENDDQSSSVCSGCSSNEMNEVAKDELKIVDLEAPQISETEISTCITNCLRYDRSPNSEVVEETAEMDSKTAAVRRDRRKPAVASKSPTEAELEEFFSGAEKYEQKRFAEKYNYDVVKDAPLEGRYQWVRLKP